MSNSKELGVSDDCLKRPNCDAARAVAATQMAAKDGQIAKLEKQCERWDLTCSTQALEIEYLKEQLAIAHGALAIVETPRDEWPEDAEYAVGHLAGLAFGRAPADEIGFCVGLITEALTKDVAPVVDA